MADGVTGYACTGTPVDCVRLVASGSWTSNQTSSSRG